MPLCSARSCRTARRPMPERRIFRPRVDIDWSAPSERIDRLIRLGGAWTTFRGARIKIHAAKLTDGLIAPTVVQPEGKPRMAYDAWRNGARPGAGEWFE